LLISFYVVTKGKTPVLAADEARAVLEAIDTVTGLRARGLIGVVVYSFARVNAVIRQVLFDRGRGELALQLLDEGGDVERLDLRELVEVVGLAPLGEAAVAFR
jgi:hypothetical protein